VTAEHRPLNGVRVLDLGRFIAAPYAGLTLADLGADVIKVEDPDHPDDARYTGPHFVGHESLYFLSLNWDKRAIGIRLGRPRGRQVFLDLAASADVVLDNYRPGVMSLLGIDHAVLSALNQRIVTCSLTGFGETGALAGRPGYDYTLQAFAGAMSLTGEPDGPPGKAGISYVDHSGGLAASLAVCAALLERERSGLGQHVDLGLIDTQISMLSYLAAWTINAGASMERTPHAAHHSIVPAQNFGTRDGWVSVFVGNDRIWSRLIAALGSSELTDPTYATNAGRLAKRGIVLTLLEAEFIRRPTAYWVELLTLNGVPCAAVQSVEEALASPPITERRLLKTATNPFYGDYRHVAGPVPAQGGAGATGAPVLGQHTESVLREVGYTADTIADLLNDGTVVQASALPSSSPA
jgi:crotonobetainyl-CoA:carnitine CoA-transferase CaiB-like acyl-CoA transferase